MKNNCIFLYYLLLFLYEHLIFYEHFIDIWRKRGIMEELDLRQLLRVILDKKIFIILMIFISLALGYAYSKYYKRPIYESSTTLVLSKQLSQGTSKNPNNTAEDDVITQNDILLNQKLVNTYNQIIKSKKVLKQVIANLNVNMDEVKLAKNISVVSVQNTEIIQITVKDYDPVIAEKIANEIPNVFATEVLNIYNIQNVYTIDKGEIAKQSSNINDLRDIAIFGMAGFIFSVMIVLLIFYFDNTIKSREDIENYLELFVLTSIPENKTKKVNSKESFKKQRNYVSKTAL